MCCCTYQINCIWALLDESVPWGAGREAEQLYCRAIQYCTEYNQFAYLVASIGKSGFMRGVPRRSLLSPLLSLQLVWREMVKVHSQSTSAAGLQFLSQKHLFLLLCFGMISVVYLEDEWVASKMMTSGDWVLRPEGVNYSIVSQVLSWGCAHDAQPNMESHKAPGITKTLRTCYWLLSLLNKQNKYAFSNLFGLEWTVCPTHKL